MTTHNSRHPSEGWDPLLRVSGGIDFASQAQGWIPAFAGMTVDFEVAVAIPTPTVMLAKARIHASTTQAAEPWMLAFASMTGKGECGP